MKKITLRILFVIFFLSLTFNLYLSFSSPYLNGDDSYFNLRNINHIKSTGLPILYDELSYGGRQVIIQPLFHYLSAMLSFIPFYFKIFPALFISSLVLITYFISNEITGDDFSSLLTALLAGFVPIYSKILINHFTVYTFVLPLIGFMLLCFIKLEERKYLRMFVISGIILSLTHSLSFLLLFVILFYVMLMNVEGLNLSRLKKETLMFMFFFIFLVSVLFFKKALFQYGFNIIYGNNPVIYQLNILQSFYLIGIFPIILGILGLYQGFFKIKKEPMVIISSIIFGVLSLLLFGLININIGLLFLSFGLIIASSLTVKSFFVYINKTKFGHLKEFFVSLFILFFVLLSLLPAYFNYEKDFLDLDSILWIDGNTHKNSIILAPLEYGHLITYFGNRANIIDGNFLLAPSPKQRHRDVDAIYSGWSYNKAVELLKDYDIDYIYISGMVKKLYNIEDLLYLEDEKCIRRIEKDIYQFVC